MSRTATRPLFKQRRLLRAALAITAASVSSRITWACMLGRPSTAMWVWPCTQPGVQVRPLPSITVSAWASFRPRPAATMPFSSNKTQAASCRPPLPSYKMRSSILVRIMRLLCTWPDFEMAPSERAEGCHFLSNKQNERTPCQARYTAPPGPRGMPRVIQTIMKRVHITKNASE